MGCGASSSAENIQTRVIPELELPPSLVRVDSQELQFRASPAVGFGTNNAVILNNDASKALVKYMLQDDMYTKVWEKPYPDSFNVVSKICILLEGFIVLRDEVQDLTEVYTSNLEHLVYSFNNKHGMLCGVARPGVLAYSEEMEEFPNCYKVCMYHVHNKHKKVSTLLAPEEFSFRKWLSVCGNPQSGWVAVLDSQREGSVLVIFNHSEHPMSRNVLRYTTVEGSGIASSHEHIFVLERHHSCVRILNWEAEEMSLVLVDELGVRDMGNFNWIANLGTGRGKCLQLASGSWPFVFAVHIFRVK